MKKLIVVVCSLLTVSIMPAYAEVPSNVSLRGYICIDDKGIHRSWTAAFDGQTFCRLVPNPAKKKK